MTMVYVLMTDGLCCDNTPIMAFDVEQEAVDVINAIREHDLSFPLMPAGPAPRIGYKKWGVQYGLWAKKHPAGEQWAEYRDHFTIIAVPLRVV